MEFIEFNGKLIRKSLIWYVTPTPNEDHYGKMYLINKSNIDLTESEFNLIKKTIIENDGIGPF